MGFNILFPAIKNNNIIKALLFTFIIAFIACDNDSRKIGNNTNIPLSYALQADTIKNPKYFSEQIDNTKGLSNSSVNCAFEDSQHLLWVGTWDGLNRYDGNSFKIFRPEPGNKFSISNQVILKVFEDKQGYIWVLTMHGINRYNKQTDRFTQFLFSNDKKPPLSESQFNMAVSPGGEVYCAVKNWGLGYLSKTGFKKFSDKNLLLKKYLKIEFLQSGELIVLTEDNILQIYDVQQYNDLKALVKKGKAIENIKTFEVTENQAAIIPVQGKPFILNTENNKRSFIQGYTNVVGHIPDGIVLADKSGYTIISPNGEPAKESWLQYLDKHKITTIIKGSENIIWAGTDGDGLLKIYPLKKTFNLINKEQIPELDGGIVRAFIKDGKNSLWVATKGKGLFKLENDFYKKEKISYKNFNENNSVINNAVFALCNAKDNLILIGTDGEGLTVYDGVSSKLVGWQAIAGSKQLGYFRSVYTIYQDKQGYIWLGTNGYGMIRCRIEREGNKLKVTDFKNYLAKTEEGNTLSNNIIFSIIPKSDKQLWIGTRLGGLNIFDKETGIFKSYKNIPGNANSLSNNDILCLATDADSTLWIGTSYGLNTLKKIDSKGNAVFTSYTVKNGLPNNTIHGVVPSGKSNIWISTNSGLSNFSVEKQKFINYTQSEGLQNNEFADGAYYYDSQSGFIYMGGIKGFNYFLPHKIKESTVIPNLLIDKISGQNQPLPYYQGLVITPQSNSSASITLKHNQNFFDIHHTALSYINNDKCRYMYQLKGFDKEWNSIGNRKIISFTNVPKGNYSLWMKWSNSDGVWSQPVHAIDIRVKPVWWQSHIALLSYLILAICFILFVRSYYLKRQSLNQNILFRKREEELHENRLAFFTNIAHEFLTPLTLIVGPAQKLSEEAGYEGRSRKYMNMIQRNASRLLFLTQQLLEFRKAEHDYLEVSVKEFDLVSLIEQIAELFDDLALDKNINYSLDISSSLQGWYDKDKLEKIIFNLMSNAFKYTPRNGTISLKCFIEKEDVNKLNITITNSGKGIPKEKLESLFDRFFLTDTNIPADTEMFRTGIGLAYIKKLVTVLHGEINVKSIPDNETTFEILIPCEKEAFKEKEIDNSTSSVVISSHLKNILEETDDKQTFVPEKISTLDAVENSKKTILIVEDEKEIHNYLNDLLQVKYRLLSAYNGAEALEIVKEEIPDLIISDVMMPVMDGVELCKNIKNNISTCHIPFIMLTAKSSVIHRIEGLESGANSYIPKPFYPEHLLVRVQKLLEEKELILKHFTQDTLIENLPEMQIDNDDKAFIKNLIEFIKKHIDDEKLSASLAEKEMGISASQLYRKTKENFNLSPGDLIRTIRLKYAAELLRKDQFTVSEICYKAGFNNRSYFYREFKKVYNTTPKNYQMLYKSKSSAFK
jgi:signal transduction histidine kinase/DNA-binding response OmpR family regulator/ligand-binding sensor domain-containing protein